MTTEPDAPRSAIVTLPCGCFFEGRKFFACDECEEDSDDGED